MKKHIIRALLYLLGIVVLAFGIVLNTKASLGVSSIITISYSISHIWNLNFANTSLVMYSSFVIIEMILRGIRKEKREFWLSILQIPFSIVFTRFMNIFDISCVAITCILCLVVKGRIIGVGIGTIASMLLIGRVIAITNHFIKKTMEQAMGFSAD